MPDIDMDFDDERRLEVVEHVRQLYGPEKVTHVITYSTIKAKQAINDAARVLDYPVYMGQRLSKMVSSDPKVKLKQVLEKQPGKEDLFNPDFAEAYKKDDDARRIIDTALSIEGLTRGEGVHACAVLICRDPVNEHVPTKLDTKGGVEITQYEGHTVADMGLLKMDFLGLRTLTVISKAKANIKKNFGIDIKEEEIPFDDPEIFKLMGSGHTAGVFQVESAGMTATIKNMKPTEYKHVVALIALYRPGPLGAGMVSSYINRMNGKEPAVSYDDRLDDILGETYGTMVYQEQVMLISVEMCGFSKGESDSRIRKPVAKKKIKLLTSTVLHWEDGSDETTYDHWMNGAIKNNYTREVAQKIWDDVLEFASYAFNKSHSAGYAILVMQTAWLKAHYPHEYMAAVLTSYTGKTDKIVHYVSACRHDGIPVLSPDVNESGTEFTATKEGVRFGLAGIRGVGTGVAQAIIAEREAGGPFKTLHDFVERVDSSQANRRVIESLIKAGAFDSTGYPRRQMMHFVDKNNPENIIDAAVKRQKDRASGQTSFFDMFGDVEGSGFEVSVPDPDGQEWDRHLKLSQEKEVLGIYVSDHPLRPFEYALAKARDFSFSQIDTGYEVQNPTGGTINQEIPEGKALWWGRHGLERVQARDQKRRPHGYCAARGHGRRGPRSWCSPRPTKRPRDTCTARSIPRPVHSCPMRLFALRASSSVRTAATRSSRRRSCRLSLTRRTTSPRCLRSWCPAAALARAIWRVLPRCLPPTRAATAWRSLSSRWTGTYCVPRCRPRSTHARFRCWQRQKPSWVTRVA